MKPVATSLVTDRLVMRPAVPVDLAALHLVYSDPAAMRYWSRPEHDTLDQTKGVLDALIASAGYEFVIEHQGLVVGKAGAWRKWEVGFILHPSVWGMGLASEAMAAVVPHLFTAHAAPALTAEIDPRNTGSLRVLTKQGFRVTHSAQNTLQWRDEWCDSLYLACDRTVDLAQR